MRVSMEKRECDQCGYAVETSAEVFNNLPFAGWLEVFENRSSVHKQPKHWDFCCLDCLIRFLEVKREDRSG